MYETLAAVIVILLGVIGFLWYRSRQPTVTAEEARAVDAIIDAAPTLSVPIGKDPDAETRPAYSIT